jgi:hypothetical protein
MPMIYGIDGAIFTPIRPSTIYRWYEQHIWLTQCFYLRGHLLNGFQGRAHQLLAKVSVSQKINERDNADSNKGNHASTAILHFTDFNLVMASLLVLG